MELHDAACGCAITPTHDYGNLSYVIAFCPLHKGAGELMGAAQEIMEQERELRLLHNSFRRLDAAIAQAKGTKVPRPNPTTPTTMLK